ncbi:MAG: M14 family metallopeptidase [Cyclobacteriaceae bacterium]
MIAKRLFPFLLIFLGSIHVYSKNLKSPAAFLGYELGEKFTSHHQIIDYYKYLADKSDLVKLNSYGQSYEGNPLVLAYVSSAENIKQSDNIRTNNLKKAGFLPGEAKPGKTIVWLSYNIHGNEAVSSEAAMETIYKLVTNPDYQHWLNECMVIIDPCLNPDGRERYISWYKQRVGREPNPNPQSVEHQEEWPGGRYNHYYFDLNRDWLWLTQKESRLRMQQYNQWLPHVHVDFHEQSVNSPYYFPPAAEPMHELITPWQREFQEAIGKNNASYFDRQGWLYFTKERFDLLYPSYGDTYPSFNGAIGMTYEQGGSGQAGLMVLTESKDTLTLQDRIDHHVATGLATVETSFQHSARLKREFIEFFKYNRENNRLPYHWLVLKSGEYPGKMEALKNLFDKHLIKYEVAARAGSGKGYSYYDRKETEFSFGPHDLIVNTRQPKGALLKVMFEPKTKLSDSVTYDITAWTLPYALGLETFATNKKPEQTGKAAAERTKLANTDNLYAYLVQWKDELSVKALSKLLQQKVKVRYSQESFTLQGENYNRGTLVINLGENEHLSGVHKIVENISQELAIEIHGVTSGLVSQGKDLGSGSFKYIEPPKVALLTGDNFSATSVGEIWHLFDYTFVYPLNRLKVSNFEDLQDYDVLILPEGRYGTLFSDNNLKALEEWIREGGKAVFIESAAQALAGKDGWGINQQKAEKKEATKAEKKQEKLKKYADRQRDAVSKMISGSIYQVSLDNTHPLALGYPEQYFTLKSTSTNIELMDNAWNVGWLDGTADPVSGFAGSRVEPKPEDSLIMGVKPIGAGHAIYFIDNPVFRLFWRNGFLAMANAVFLVD